jgi:lauroyl/myristoyl acyltransferase
MRAVQGGEVVTIVATSTEGSEMVEGSFLGGQFQVAVGAPRLAALTRAPLLPVFAVRDAEIGFRIIIEAPIALAAGKSSDESCVAATQEFLHRCEPWVRQFPEQWRAWSKWQRAKPALEP